MWMILDIVAAQEVGQAEPAVQWQTAEGACVPAVSRLSTAQQYSRCKIQSIRGQARVLTVYLGPSSLQRVTAIAARASPVPEARFRLSQA